MRVLLVLSEDELKQAVTDYVAAQGYKNTSDVQLRRDGYPDSPDIREQKLTFTAEVRADAPRRSGKSKP